MEPNAQFNADIEAFLLNAGTLEIDARHGLSELARYFQELQARAAGVAYSELGISTRRDSSRPQILELTDTPGTYTFASAYDLRNTEQKVKPGSIALLKLSGVMRSESGISTRGMDALSEDLRLAYANPNISGVIIETNSPGGESLAGTLLRSTITERNKPVVGFGHLVASAAYRALSAADEIILSGAGAEAGSIGTMVALDAQLIQNLRNRSINLYGSTAPNKNSAGRGIMAGDFLPLQKQVDASTLNFQNEVRDSRPLSGSAETIAETLDGSMWLAEEAKNRGLVDLVGNMQLAIRRVQLLSTTMYNTKGRKGQKS